MNCLIVDKIIKEALIEDIPNDDISTEYILDNYSIATADLLCKQDGIISGLEVFKRVFDILGNVDVILYKKDSDRVYNGEKIAQLKGSTKNILKGERVALNILQRMSGVATLTNEFVQKLNGSKTKLLDTRKTTPSLRILEKYAVTCGGGYNHRFNLSDGIMLKDNHISACGGIKNAVSLIRKKTSFVRKIEVEVENLSMVREAVEAGADIIMLDNMSHENMREAMNIIGGKALVEVSGNVTKENIAKITDLGVDFVSSGALTHSAPIMDISLKNLHPVQE